MTRLKQICNHPELVSVGGDSLGGRSGKLDRVTDMLAELTSTDQRALVFMQYRKTGELLAEHFRTELGASEVPFLHGGLSNEARQDIVARFQDDPDGPPVLLLSLRAAGFGLNLTRGTHVVHYDRWWKPLPRCHEDKRALASMATGETTSIDSDLAQLSDEQLRELLAPSRGGRQ